ncbi:crossover junction endodeoxyribonuclease RuvC [Candidatus Roizmanbacteria bacterium]|nr:crossover junction endodeoxyribonuclease RuvC [Candidatus Roizmanbacteria bacterium]
MIIMSIDPGIDRVGYAFFDKKSSSDYTYLSSGLIQTDKKCTPEKRLLKIHSDLESLALKLRPKLLIMERIFFFKNQKTIVAVGQAQGVIMLLAAEHTMPVIFMTPLEIKQIVTGYGQADKKSVQKMLQMSLGLIKELKQDDQADAIACGYAYCCINQSLV